MNQTREREREMQTPTIYIFKREVTQKAAEFRDIKFLKESDMSKMIHRV